MKGIVFNLLQEAIEQAHGPDLWDELLEQAKLEGAYTSLGSYAHAELGALVEAASRRLDLPADDVVRWFGATALPLLARRYPHFFKPHTTARSLLLSLNDIIHPEVRKIYPEAEAPSFDFEGSTPEVLMMSYFSRRGLCAFAEGLVQGTAAYYSEPVTIEQPQCSKRGDARCVFRIRFRPPV